MRFEEFSTQFVQQVGKKEGPISPVMINSASFGYGDSETGEGIFDGSVKKPLYSRMGNPTSGQLESILAAMDGGVGAIAASSGMGSMALITNAKKRALRDFGMSANGFGSYLTMLGLETLPLRMDRIVSSVEKVALTLDAAGFNINHPILPQHPHHERYKEQFSQGCGTLFTIDIGSKEAAFAFLNRSKLITITANIGDSRTLGLHMASTIFTVISMSLSENFLGLRQD